MIVSAMVLVIRKDELDVVLPVHRHRDAYRIMSELGYEIDDSCSILEGFKTDKGEFLDRKRAADHAYECGQLIETAEEPRIEVLMSEDLW